MDMEYLTPPPPPAVNGQTPEKTLPSPIFRLRAVTKDKLKRNVGKAYAQSSFSGRLLCIVLNKYTE